MQENTPLAYNTSPTDLHFDCAKFRYFVTANTPKVKVAELKDQEAENSLNHNGFVVFKNFLNAPEVAELFALYKNHHPKANTDKGMWNSLYDISPDQGLSISEQILSILRPKLNALFVSYYAPVGTFMSKNCNPHSTCDLHRDFSILNEQEFQYRNIWIPLVSTNNNNGALYVLRGSNHVFDYVLPFQTQWPYGNLQNDLFPMVETVDAEAGDLVIYLDKTLHGSHVNYSNDSRPVVHFGVLHPDVELRFYQIDEMRENVKVYSVPFKFFFERDFDAVAQKYPLIQQFKFSPPALQTADVKARLKSFSAEPASK